LGAVRAAMTDAGPYVPSAKAAARRGLKNVALGYLVASGDSAAYDAADAQQRIADNMTDRLAAVAALAQSPAPQREAALARFEADFADEPLAMDKWFTLQATMHRQPDDPPVLERVGRLMSHPAFSLRNPNKVRSLVSAFCTGNLAEFHSADGAGYRFWAAQVLALDATNPQVAARLARALDRWRKFAPQRQALMQAALAEVRDRARSADVIEVVDKALVAAAG
ncbi:MAG TPA: aminopeptidase N C-terminal domain-containing protein, partial [Burkholderiaceae bacterium]|nr:aminopeptidase N C-terminal domain-containing protein [Burkholderiaceae bacterium]